MGRIAGSWMMLGLTLFLTAGCRTMTGQTAGHSLDDTTITATVKAHLATGDRVGTLTRINVTTVENTVYLSGLLPSQEEKEKAEVIAVQVEGVKNVVNNIEVHP